MCVVTTHQLPDAQSDSITVLPAWLQVLPGAQLGPVCAVWRWRRALPFHREHHTHRLFPEELRPAPSSALTAEALGGAPTQGESREVEPDLEITSRFGGGHAL